MEGTISAYKFHTEEDENFQSKLLFHLAFMYATQSDNLFSVLVDENDPTPANYIVLKDTDCFGYDVHNNRPRPALTLNACIQQC